MRSGRRRGRAAPALAARRGLDSSGLSGRRDRARRLGRVLQRVEADLVGVGEGGLLARDRAHADALLDVEAAGLDDALLQAPALVARVLEVEVGVVDLARGERAEHALELAAARGRRARAGSSLRSPGSIQSPSYLLQALRDRTSAIDDAFALVAAREDLAPRIDDHACGPRCGARPACVPPCAGATT